MGTGNTSTNKLVREEVETAVVALELLAIRNGNAAFLTDDPRAQNRLLSAARKAQLVAGHLWGLLPLASSGEVQTEAPPPPAAAAPFTALDALWIVARAMAGNPALRAALLDVAQRGDKIARRQRGQRARWLAYHAAVVALDAGKVDAAEVAAVVSSAGHRTPPGIRAWYRRALVELDRKAGAA
jgi:hypothetical protein